MIYKIVFMKMTIQQPVLRLLQLGSACRPELLRIKNTVTEEDSLCCLFYKPV